MTVRNIYEISKLVLFVILLLNIIFLIIYFRKTVKYKSIPLAIAIVDLCKIYSKKNNRVKKKLKYIYVCDSEEELTKKYYYNMITLIIILISLIMIVSMVVLIFSKEEDKLINNQYINRPDYGEVKDEVNINVQYEDSYGNRGKTDVDICLEPNRLSEEEEEKLFQNVEQYIRDKALGDNESYDSISNKLNLITTYDKDKNISIAWTTDSYGIVDSEGNIHMDNIEKMYPDEELELIATITYFDRKREVPLDITVTKKEDSSQTVIQEIKEYIEDTNTKYIVNGLLKLPTRVGDYTVSYGEEKSNNKMDNWGIIICLGVISIIIVIIYMDKELDRNINEKNKQLLLSYGEVVNKIQLLVCAGLTIESAWEKICLDYLNKKEINGISYVYEEMVYTLNEINTGMSHIEAFKSFGKRIGLIPYVKLSSFIIQNIKSGSEKFICSLELEAKSVEGGRKELLIKKGGQLGVKLLIPMMVMLVLTLIIVVLPAFLTI